MPASQVTQESINLLGEQLPEPRVTRESGHLLEALLKNKIRFAHWKSNGHLKEALEGKTDIDILIYPEDRDSFEQLMRRLEYKKLKSQPWSSYPDVEDWIGLDDETGNFLHLHTHYALVTGIRHVKHLYLPWTETFFKHLKADEQTGWPIPKPELEAIILLIRIRAKMPPLARLNKKPEIPVYMQTELVDLLRNTNLSSLTDMCKRLDLLVPADLGISIQKIIIEDNTFEIVQLAKHFYAQLKPFYRTTWPVALIKSFYYKFLLKTITYASRLIGPVSMGKKICGGGKIITLIGCDGSGKSTLSADILKWLTYKIDTHYFYMGKNPFIKSYNKILISITDIFFHKPLLARLSRKLLGDFYYIILIRKKLSMLQQARRMTQQGSIIICDRFPQQQIYGFNDGPNLQKSNNNWISALEMKLFNRVKNLGADLVFRLRVSPEVAAMRKPEHPYEKIKMKAESIDSISFTNAVIIDTDADQPYDQVLLKIKKEIWKNL